MHSFACMVRMHGFLCICMYAILHATSAVLDDAVLLNTRSCAYRSFHARPLKPIQKKIIQQIERKIARGMGERSDEEKKQLKLMIEEAEHRKEDAKEKRKMLQSQTRCVAEEVIVHI